MNPVETWGFDRKYSRSREIPEVTIIVDLYGRFYTE